VHCVDLGESFPTSIFLQKLVSIQLKTSPETSKFDFRITQRFDFPMVFSPAAAHPVARLAARLAAQLAAGLRGAMRCSAQLIRRILKQFENFVNFPFFVIIFSAAGP